MSSFSDVVFMVYTVYPQDELDGWWDTVCIEAVCEKEEQAKLLTEHFKDYKYVRTSQGYVDLFNSMDGFRDYTEWKSLEDFEEYCSKRPFKCTITLRNILAKSEEDARRVINSVLVAVDEYDSNERNKIIKIEEQRW